MLLSYSPDSLSQIRLIQNWKFTFLRPIIGGPLTSGTLNVAPEWLSSGTYTWSSVSFIASSAFALGFAARPVPLCPCLDCLLRLGEACLGEDFVGELLFLFPLSLVFDLLHLRLPSSSDHYSSGSSIACPGLYSLSSPESELRSFSGEER